MFEYCLKKIKKYFFDDFNANDFGYVLYPFLRIFKLFGFLPVKLEAKKILNENTKLKLCLWSCLGTLVGMVLFVAGFLFGVHDITMNKSMAELHESTVIAWFTTQIQIIFLFVLGSYGLLNTWCNISQMQQLFLWISKIDQQLEQTSGREINYLYMRRKLFVQFFVVFLVPSTLSMVNCIVIHLGPDKVNFYSPCFWFVCFLPILLLTFKEFQFYNLMFVLKSKFDFINKELLQYGGENLLVKQKYRKVNVLNTTKPECKVETIKHLLEIYSNIADCVDLLLKVFSWHLLLLTSASFGVITIQGYNLFAALIVHTMEMDSYQLTVVMGWILIQIVVIGINVSTCSMTAKAMSSTGPLLHKIKSSSIQNCCFYQNLQIFSMEVMMRKHSFTAAGFFNMDYKLITSIIAAVTTYLLIIIQFHFSNIPQQKTP